jgi:DNA-binding NtrC family response regulator
MSRILIIEDEDVIRNALRRLLERHDYRVSDAPSIEAATAPEAHDLILCDLRLPGRPGTDIMGLAPGVPVIIMTSYASVSSAVEAMKQGATDYITKPFDHEELLLLIRRILDQRRQRRRTEALQKDVDRNYPIEGMIGRSEAMSAVCARIKRVAPTDATVLILGESGTGKELAARAVHRQSRRAGAPFVAFNCAAAPEQGIENELFGRNGKGGLLQQARDGTLFLDEIGELPLPAQARLLRLMSEPAGEKQPPVRIIAATHRDLRRQVQEQQFRSDLYFRLRVVELSLPPLRERGDDVIELAIFLLDRHAGQLGRPEIRLGRDALTAIRRYRWPGNVRELSNAIERAVILCEGDIITPDLLAIDHQVDGARQRPEIEGQLSLEEYFRTFVLEHQDHMNETELAQALGISRKTLWERRQRYGLPRKRR